MFRISNGFVLATIIVLSAGNWAAAQTDVLVPPVDLTQQKAIGNWIQHQKTGMPFMPLINDVENFSQDAAHPDAAHPDAAHPDAAHPDAAHPDAAKINVTPGQLNPPGWRIQVVAGKLDESALFEQQLSCPAEHGESCPSCQSSQPLVQIGNPVHRPAMLDQYCDRIASILVAKLTDKQLDPQAKQAAVETALKLVAARAGEAAEEKVKQLELSQQQALKRMMVAYARQNQASSASQETSEEQVDQSQKRNAKQLEHLAAVDRSILRSLLNLEKKFASFSMMQRAKFSDADVRRMMRSVEAEEKRREDELAKLQDELQVLDQRIKTLQATPVQHATYLEPMFQPERTLEPIAQPNPLK